MKKLIALLVVTAFLVGTTVGCGGSATSKAATSTGGGSGEKKADKTDK